MTTPILTPLGGQRREAIASATELGWSEIVSVPLDAKLETVIEQRPVKNERVKLSVLSAGIHSCGQVGDECFIKQAAAELVTEVS